MILFGMFRKFKDFMFFYELLQPPSKLKRYTNFIFHVGYINLQKKIKSLKIYILHIISIIIQDLNIITNIKLALN